MHYSGPMLQALQGLEMSAKCKFCNVFAGADISQF
jgi:hypothetical protein